MTQKIFDTDNEKDMKLLWSILPEQAHSIRKRCGCQSWYQENKDTGYNLEALQINWHDKTEITRPVNYEDMIGCVGWFDGCGDEMRLGILTKVAPNDEDGYCFLKNNNIWCKTFRPAKKSELKFYGE